MQNLIPLAARFRPRHLSEFAGQQHLLNPGKPLYEAILQGKLHSLILWGPPGTGKTTLAQLIAQHAQAQAVTLSAVLAGVKELRAVIDEAVNAREAHQHATVLIIDEIHRFNKAQQDVLLPHVESGLLTLVGATTENPSFELNKALLSRVRVYIFRRLEPTALLALIENVLKDTERGLGHLSLDFPIPLRERLAQVADGDARQLFNLLHIAVDLAGSSGKITEAILAETLSGSTLRRFDKQGEHFYDQISALHKSIRGSAPDAALYWLGRILDGGCDPLYLARRIVRTASEDIGNADPRALTIALNAWDVQERLGSPEGELALAQAVVYLACAPKSNAVYRAFQRAVKAAKQYGSLEVPIYLRNAPTALMKKIGYGKNYRYAHDEPHHYAAGERYFPEEMTETQYYFPADQGMEIQIAEKLARLKKWDEEARKTEKRR